LAAGPLILAAGHTTTGVAARLVAKAARGGAIYGSLSDCCYRTLAGDGVRTPASVLCKPRPV
jgi:hypothetical protein